MTPHRALLKGFAPLRAVPSQHGTRGVVQGGGPPRGSPTPTPGGFLEVQWEDAQAADGSQALDAQDNPTQPLMDYSLINSPPLVCTVDGMTPHTDPAPHGRDGEDGGARE